MTMEEQNQITCTCTIRAFNPLCSGVKCIIKQLCMCKLVSMEVNYSGVLGISIIMHELYQSTRDPLGFMFRRKVY